MTEPVSTYQHHDSEEGHHPRLLWVWFLGAGFIGGAAAGLIYILVVAPQSLALPTAAYVVVIGSSITAFIGLISAGGAILFRGMVPERIRGAGLTTLFVAVGAIVGCSAGYFLFFAGASQIDPLVVVPLFGLIAAIVFSAINLLGFRFSNGPKE